MLVDGSSGRLTLIPNTYSGSGKVKFGKPVVNVQEFSCDQQGWKPGIFDLAVRFADLDGDGRYVFFGFVVWCYQNTRSKCSISSIRYQEHTKKA